MTDEPTHIATAAAAPDDPYAALNQHLHGDGERQFDASVYLTDGRAIAEYLGDLIGTGSPAFREIAITDAGCAIDRLLSDWRTRALAAEAEVGRLRSFLLDFASHRFERLDPLPGDWRDPADVPEPFTPYLPVEAWQDDARTLISETTNDL